MLVATSVVVPVPIGPPVLRFRSYFGKCARADLEADAVPWQEDVGGAPHVDLERRHRAGLEQFLRAPVPVTEAGPHHAVAEPLDETVGMYVEQLSGEVRVRR